MGFHQFGCALSKWDEFRCVLGRERRGAAWQTRERAQNGAWDPMALRVRACPDGGQSIDRCNARKGSCSLPGFRGVRITS